MAGAADKENVSQYSNEENVPLNEDGTSRVPPKVVEWAKSYVDSLMIKYPDVRAGAIIELSRPTGSDTNTILYNSSNFALSATSATLLVNAATAARERRAQFENRAIRVANIQFLHSGYEDEPPNAHGFSFIAWDQASAQVLVATSVPKANVVVVGVHMAAYEIIRKNVVTGTRAMRDEIISNQL